jgi:hypothetical protein
MVDVHAIIHFVSMGGAHLDTFAAGNTPVGKVLDLLMRVSSLRVVAPEAAHCTSFEKNGRSDAGPVVNGESLYMKDEIFVHRIRCG